MLKTKKIYFSLLFQQLFPFLYFLNQTMESPFYLYLKDKVHVRPEHLPKLMQLIHKRSVSKNEILLFNGQICSSIFFVEKGLLRLYSADETGKEHIIQFAPENWFLSERGSLYFGTPSDFFIDALEETSLVVFDQKFIDRAAEISPEFRTYNEYILQNHIRELQLRINLLIGSNAQKRYTEFIKLYPDLTMRIPQWMIASYLGITAESLSRVRKMLAQQKK